MNHVHANNPLFKNPAQIAANGGEKVNSGYRRVPRQSVHHKPEAAMSRTETDISREEARKGGAIFDNLYDRMTDAEQARDNAYHEIDTMRARIHTLQKQLDDRDQRIFILEQHYTLHTGEREAIDAILPAAIDMLQDSYARFKGSAINRLHDDGAMLDLEARERLLAKLAAKIMPQGATEPVARDTPRIAAETGTEGDLEIPTFLQRGPTPAKANA